MQKGDKARVINDCEVKAGSEVEVEYRVTLLDTDTFAERFAWYCWFNGMSVRIAESDLEVIKPKRWEPGMSVRYWFPNIETGSSEDSVWLDSPEDWVRRSRTGVFKTREESDAMLAKIQALVTSEIGKA